MCTRVTKVQFVKPAPASQRNAHTSVLQPRIFHAVAYSPRTLGVFGVSQKCTQSPTLSSNFSEDDQVDVCTYNSLQCGFGLAESRMAVGVTTLALSCSSTVP